MTSWKDTYRTKILSATDAIRMIKTGGPRIFIGTGCGQPQTLVEELVSNRNEIIDAEIYTFYTEGSAPYISEECARKFRLNTFYVAPNVQDAVATGRADYLPASVADIPRFFKSGQIPLDVALIQTSVPDKNGYVSLGVSVDIVRAAIENSVMVIAEVNERMPRTWGDSFLAVDMIDALVESDRGLVEIAAQPDDEILKAIAHNTVALIEDGSTVGLGIGALPQAILAYLGSKNDIGIHTELFGDPIIQLIESGVVNGKKKTINRGKVTASLCCGTRKLYEYLNENQKFEFRPAEYVADPSIICQHARMVSIGAAQEIDMTGQVCTESQGYAFTAGIGGTREFATGAARSKDGKSIIVLPSTSKDGKISRIVPHLAEGSGVAINRGAVHYVVTEYGAAYLFGKNIRERVVALAEIAHPDFRNELLKEAKKHHYVFPDTRELLPKVAQYPREHESRMALADGTELFFRPIRPTDEKILRDMLYSCSEQSIAFRFFKPIKSFPHRFIQEFTMVDYEKDMAIIGLVQDTGGEHIVGVGRYYLNQTSNRAEVSFLVRDDWQHRGIGTYLLDQLIDIARKRKIKGFDASVLGENQSMLAIFYNTGYKISTKREGDMYQISFDFKDQ